MTGAGMQIGSAIGTEWDASDYIVCEPGRLIATYMQPEYYEHDWEYVPSLSVVRFIDKVSTDSELYRPIAELTEGLKVLCHLIDGRQEVTIFEVAK